MTDSLKENYFDTSVFEVLGRSNQTADYDRWLGVATREAIARLGWGARPGQVVGFEHGANFPEGWVYRAPLE